EALATKEAGEERVIPSNHSGHGFPDPAAYDAHNRGELVDERRPGDAPCPRRSRGGSRPASSQSGTPSPPTSPSGARSAPASTSSCGARSSSTSWAAGGTRPAPSPGGPTRS